MKKVAKSKNNGKTKKFALKNKLNILKVSMQKCFLALALKLNALVVMLLLLLSPFAVADLWDSTKASHSTTFTDTITSRGVTGDGKPVIIADGEGLLITTGNVGIGTTSIVSVGSSSAPKLQVAHDGGSNFGFSVVSYDSDQSTGGAFIGFGRANTNTVGGATLVTNGQNLGEIRFAGADDTDLESRGAAITAQVDGTPGSNDMPGRLIFSTTADGASSETERMRITNGGNVGIGTTSPNRKLVLYEGDFQITNVAMGSTSTDGGMIGPDASNNLQILNWENANIEFLTNGANERMVITSAGNVGIGTNNPDPNMKLDVNGKIKSTNIQPFSATVSWSGESVIHSFNSGDDSLAKVITVGSDVACAGFSAVLAVTSGYNYCNVAVLKSDTRGGAVSFSCTNTDVVTHQIKLNSGLGWGCSGSPPSTYVVNGISLNSR